jgi:ADP-ribose pyrophosphatase
MGKWEFIGEEEGNFGFRPKFIHRYRMPGGEEVKYDMSGGRGGVSVFAVTKSNEVIIVTQFRPGPAGLTIEMPGGGIDEGETLHAAAARELLEETGYAGSTPVLLGSTQHPFALYQNHSVMITDCEKVAEPNPDELEDIEFGLIPIDVFISGILPGYSCPDLLTVYRGLERLGRLTIK